VAGEFPVALVFRRVFLRATRKAHALLDLGLDFLHRFALAGDRRDDRFPMVDPNAHISSHRVHLC
jgi:hypothetical protein